ncbi:hypothetical protein F4778DRAFT_778926 [Xylariomycetidae sp. FL2044]|nr:hypothetical protein F4778DRAFT_778926 [Xylariomycetidae sp. FL2044]
MPTLGGELFVTPIPPPVPPKHPSNNPGDEHSRTAASAKGMLMALPEAESFADDIRPVPARPRPNPRPWRKPWMGPLDAFNLEAEHKDMNPWGKLVKDEGKVNLRGFIVVSFKTGGQSQEERKGFQTEGR